MQGANSKSALGMDGNLTALLGYIIGIIALILIFIEKDNRFVRFHAIQSVLWAVVFVVGVFAVVIIGVILGVILGSVNETLGGLVFGLTGLLYFLCFIGFFGGLIYAAIKAYGGNMVKLPIAGGFAEKFAGN
jgi:uncharacterized membrane protein